MRAVHLADMFCGAGLFSDGFVREGATPLFAADLAPDAVASYNLNIAPTARVCSVGPELVLPEVDILIAGPPCQGFSTLGAQDPADARNVLCLSLPAIASDASASVVVVENVPPFLKSHFWAQMVADFRGRGYDVQAWTLDAVDYGAPQKRVRSFTIASRIGLPQRPGATTAKKSVAQAFAGIDRSDPLHVWPEPTPSAKKRISQIPAVGDKRDLMRLAPELCPPSWFRMGAQATDVWGRMDASEPANTLRCRFQNPSTGRYLHPVEDRVVSLREGARLQGVPDEWRFVGHANSIARQIGNGVPLPLGAAVAKSVMALFQTVAVAA